MLPTTTSSRIFLICIFCNGIKGEFYCNSPHVEWCYKTNQDEFSKIPDRELFLRCNIMQRFIRCYDNCIIEDHNTITIKQLLEQEMTEICRFAYEGGSALLNQSASPKKTSNVPMHTFTVTQTKPSPTSSLISTSKSSKNYHFDIISSMAMAILIGCFALL